jgi:hypothetical protein
MTWPWRSSSTWISIWRGCSTNFSMKTRSSPNAALASLRQEAKPSFAWASS